MKTLIGLLSVLIVLTAHASGRKVQQPVPDPFCLWQTNSDFLWLASEPAPDPTGAIAGPSFFFRRDGSLFSGKSIAAAWVIDDFSVGSPLFASSMIDSNEPTALQWRISVQDNSFGNYYSFMHGYVHADQTYPDSLLELESYPTNGNRVTLNLHAGVGQPFIVAQGPDPVFLLDWNGVASATGFGVVSTVGFSSTYTYGITTNINVLLPDASTVQLQFTGGILTGIASP